MRRLRRLTTAAIYAFSAWMLATMIVYAGCNRYGALPLCFWQTFRIYFRLPGALPPAAAAAASLLLIAGLDAVIVVPHLQRASDLFLDFWNWELPGALVAASIVGAHPRRPGIKALSRRHGDEKPVC